MKTFVVTGASSGLGREIGWFLKDSPLYEDCNVINWSVDTGVDVTEKDSILAAANRIDGHIDGLVNCAGINIIDWFAGITVDEWDAVMNTNARGMFLTTQVLLERLRGGVVCNIISNASHMPMTHSAAYNASKGAAHILTLQMGRELKKTHGITVFGVSPNKLAGTGMSNQIEERVMQLRGWTREQAYQYQLAALPAGQETDPEACAAFIVFLLTNPDIHKFLNCCIMPFGA